MDAYNMSGNDAGIHAAPLSFLRGGRYYYDNGNLLYRGERGYYWESRVNSPTSSHYLNFRSTYLNPQYGNNKSDGHPLRCIVRIPPPTYE